MSSVLYDISLTDLRIFLVESEFYVFIHLPFVNFSDLICKIITSNMPTNIDYVFNLTSEFSFFQVFWKLLIMRILSWKVNFLILIDKKSAVSNAENFVDFSENMIRNFLECFCEVLSFDKCLIVLIVTQPKGVSITVHTNDTTVSAWVINNLCRLMHVRLCLFVNDSSSRLDLTPRIKFLGFGHQRIMFKTLLNRFYLLSDTIS